MSRYAHNEICEPCGTCAWCAQRWKWKERSEAQARELRKLRKLTIALFEAVQSEIFAAGGDMDADVRAHPHYAKKLKLLNRARRALAKGTP